MKNQIVIIIALLISLGAAKPSTDVSDVLPLGSVWKGTSNLEAYATRPEEHRPMTMRITKREDNKFAARCTMTTPGGITGTYEVEGLVEGEKIRWITTKVIKGEGDGAPPAEGVIKDNKIEARFDGTGKKKGHPRRGTIKLDCMRERK